MVVLLVALGILLVALATALAAENRGQSPGLWFLVGLALPGIGLLLVLLLRPADDDGQLPTPVEAARANAVARALADRPRQSTRDLALATGQDDTVVVRQLGALAALELASSDRTGRWTLTPSGAEAMTGAALDHPSAA